MCGTASVAIIIKVWHYATMMCAVMAVVVISVMSRIYWWIIWVIRWIVWVIATPAPIWVPSIAPVIRAVSPIWSIGRIPEWIPEWVPVAESDSEAERYGHVRL